MSATCIICGYVATNEVEENNHLRLAHESPEGGFQFHWEAVKFFSPKPSMQIAHILDLTNGNRTAHVFEEREGKRIYYDHANAVDLTHEPWLFVDLPATL